MSRSGYTNDYDYDDPLAMGRYRQAVKRAIEGRRGQAFLRALADAMDAMPTKVLIDGSFATDDGCYCTMGVYCAAKGIDMSDLRPDGDFDDDEWEWIREQAGAKLNIAPTMVAEIAYANDEGGRSWNGEWGAGETPAERWTRMRRWVAAQIVADP